MTSLTQEFTIIDYMGPLVVAIIFAIVLLLISFFIINFCLITKYDDLTVFEKHGYKYNMRMGPHTLDQVKRGGYASTFATDKLEEVQKKSMMLMKQLSEDEKKLLLKHANLSHGHA